MTKTEITGVVCQAMLLILDTNNAFTSSVGNTFVFSNVMSKKMFITNQFIVVVIDLIEFTIFVF